MSCDARYTGREHVMKEFIEVQPGDVMVNAGAYFPAVLLASRPVVA